MLRHKIGNIIYFYDITATKGGPSLSSFVPPCDSEIVPSGYFVKNLCQQAMP